MVELNTFSETWPRSGSMRNGHVSEHQTLARPIAGNGSLSWQTPATFQGKYRRQVGQTERAELLLPGQAENWATPTSRDWKDGSNPSDNVPTNALLGRQAPRTPMPGQKSSENDPTSPRRWASPQSRDYRSVTGNESAQREHATQILNVQVDETGRKRLNPKFVEWLMGWPEGWIELHSFVSSETE